MIRLEKGILFSLILLFVLVSSGLFASDDVIVEDIVFTGLKRTKPGTAFQIIRPLEIGAAYTAETEELLIQALREAGIFNPDITVDASREGDGVRIVVHVKDRWTLIPVPIFGLAKDGSWSGGALTIENNFFGFNKTLGLGFFFGSEGWTLISFFSDPLFLGSNLGVTAGISAGLDEAADQDVEENAIRDYQADKLGFSFGMEYPIIGPLSLVGTWEYDRSYSRTEGESSVTVPDLDTFGITGGFKWKDLFYDIPYDKGLLLKFSSSWNWGWRGTEDFLTLRGKIEWSFSPWSDHLLTLSVGGGWGDLPIQKQFRLGGRPGSYTLPMNKIAADGYAAGAVVYNVPLWFFPGGTLSGKGFYEAGYLESDLIAPTYYHGLGLGFDVFVNNLAIPAVSLNLGWNLMTGKVQFSAGVGTAGAPD